MNEQPTPQQISVAEIATAIGTENLVLRLVQLQRQVTELEQALAALQSRPQQAVDMERLVAKEPVKNGR